MRLKLSVEPVQSDNFIDPQAQVGAGLRRALGLFGSLGPTAQRVTYGASVAMRGFIRALLAYDSPMQVRFYADPMMVDACRSELRNQLAIGKTGDVSVETSLALPSQIARGEFAIWHDPGAPTRLRAALDLREAFSDRRYPITFTHHTISYHGQLHDLILPLLLSDVSDCDSVICSSSAARSALGHLLDKVAADFNQAHGTSLRYNGRLDVIPLGVETESFRPGDKLQARATLGLPSAAFIILWLGRLSQADKADLFPMLQVFHALLKAGGGPRLLLILAGAAEDPEYEAQLMEYARRLGVGDSVLIKRPVDPTTWYTAANVFVSPSDSIQECFGLSAIEAMACGLPQVVSDWDGYRETVVHGETGFRVPTRWIACDDDAVAQSLIMPHGGLPHLTLGQSVVVDLGALEESLRILIHTPELCARMSDNSRERALRQFDWKRVLDRYHELWQELMTMAASRAAPRKCAMYSRPSYYTTFVHYATEALTTKATVRITASGTDVLRGATELPNYRVASAVVSHALCAVILQVLNRAAPDGLCWTIDDLVRVATEDRSQDAGSVRRHVMWLIKYGLAEVASDRQARGAVSPPRDHEVI